jgi:hypothetical protein
MLAVTTSGGDYVVSFDGAPTCTSQTLSDSTSPTLQVTQTPAASTPTTFQPGADAGVHFEGAAGAPTTFDFSAAPAATTINASTGQATLGASGTDTFSGISAFVGSASGSTQFIVGAGGVSFTGQGSNNSLSLAPAPASSTIDAGAGTATIGTGTVTFANVGTFIGSNSGSNTFIAGTSSESFADHGSAGGDTVDFSNVATSPGTPLTVNVSGSNFNGQPTATGVVGATTYSFSTGGPDFSSFTGAASGNTRFLAGSSVGNFKGKGTGNSLDLSTAPAGTAIDASTGQVTIGTVVDMISGISSFVGSASGSTQFVAAAGQSETFIDGGSTGGDTLNLSHVVTSSSTPLTLNLTSNTVNGQAPSTAVLGTTTYTFTAGNNFAAFVGSSVGNSDVLAGRASGFRFTAKGSANTLDLSHTSAFVTLNLGQAGSQATGGAGTVTLSGTIQNVLGSNFGNHLAAGSGTVTLRGGSGVDWLQAGSGTDTLDAGLGSATLVGGAGVDNMKGGTGKDTFIPGTGGGSITDTAGIGTLDFALAKAAVRVNLGTKYTTMNHVVLAAQLVTGGGGKPISLLGLSSVIGSSYAGDVIRLGTHQGTIMAGNGAGDQLVGSTAGGSSLHGGAGGDTFTSAGPNDHMFGGAGNDTFFANNGFKDYMNGGGGHNAAHVDCADVHAMTFLKIQKVYKPSHC